MSHNSNVLAATQTPPLPPSPPPVPANISNAIDDTKRSTTSAATQSRATTPSLKIDECLWSISYPELQIACYLNRVCQFEKPKMCQYNESIPSIIQIGPTCGLAALSMLANGTPSPEQFLKIAKERAYTLNGEMFSAQYLYELASEAFAAQPEIICKIHTGNLNCAYIKEQLQQGACLLVSYPF